MRAVAGVLSALSILCPLAAQQPQPANGPITISALAGIAHPSQAAWSPDGSRAAFLWDRAGVQNVFLVSVDAPAPRALTAFESPTPDGAWLQNGAVQLLGWDASGVTVYFAHSSDLWTVAADGSRVAGRVWTEPVQGSGLSLSPDRSTLAFARAGDIWVRSLQTGAERRLTSTPATESAPAWSPDGRQLLFSSAEVSGQTDAPTFNGPKLQFTWNLRANPDVGTVKVEGGEVMLLGPSPATEAFPQWLDGQRVLLQRTSVDQRTRQLLVADASTGSVRSVREDSDEKYWSITFVDPAPRPSPDGRWIAFLADGGGWDHLFVVPSTGGAAVQLTRGDFEVRRPVWSPDSRSLAFDFNSQATPGARSLGVVRLPSGTQSGSFETLTSGRGVDGGALWSPAGDRLLFYRSSPQHPPELFVVSARGGERGRLTESLPAALRQTRFVEPQFVRYPAPDGSQVPAYLYVPHDLDRSRSHPAIIWIHGDGHTQNFDGWHDRRDYAVYSSFHQFLLQQGYVVLAVDYRGSIGYGRAWRQGHYRDLGGKDYADVAAGKAYLDGLGFVDPARVGVWGLSYGGFLTLQALTVTPRFFACGVNVAGVQNWSDWYRDPGGPWIQARMGNPADDPELYRRASPIHRVAEIVRPLLVLHGTADVNVPFLESVRLVDELARHGKEAEFMMYPGEFHYFHRAHVLEDAWRRVDAFFGRCLSGRGPSD